MPKKRVSTARRTEGPLDRRLVSAFSLDFSLGFARDKARRGHVGGVYKPTAREIEVRSQPFGGVSTIPHLFLPHPPWEHAGVYLQPPEGQKTNSGPNEERRFQCPE